MKYKLFGFLLIALPIILVIVLGVNDMEYAWYFSENYRLYDLIKSTILMLIMMIGMAIAFGRAASYLNFAIGLCFVFFQTFSWSFDTHRYISKVQLESSDSVFLLVSHNAGALAGTASATLDIAKKRYAVFFKFDSSKSFEDVKSGMLSLSENSSKLNVELELYSGDKQSISYNVSDILI